MIQKYNKANSLGRFKAGAAFTTLQPHHFKPPVICDVSAPRKAWRIWSGGSPGMERVNHPPLPSVAPLAERCFGHRRLEHA